MRRATLLLLFASAGCCPPEHAKTVTLAPPKPEAKDLAEPGEGHLKNLRQLTFGGDNAEAYWSFAGDKLILPDQPRAVQVRPDRGDARRHGRARQAGLDRQGPHDLLYFLKGDQEIIYASTHDDGRRSARRRPTCRRATSGASSSTTSIARTPTARTCASLTDTPGYDAEATVCPKDGSIIFTSMRAGDLEL